MKRLFVLALIIVLSACENKVNNNDNNDSQKNRIRTICEFYPLDFFKAELTCHSNNYQFALVLEPNYAINKDADYSEHKLRGETIEAKERELADTLRALGYDTNFMTAPDYDIIIRMMYGGVSEQPRIYSSKEFAEIPAGNNLSGCFELVSAGEIKYPEMVFIDKGNRKRGSMRDIYKLFSFEDFFFPGRILFSLDPFIDIGISIKDEYSKYLIEPISFILEIPVTGLDSKGEETTVIFTAELPASPA